MSPIPVPLIILILSPKSLLSQIRMSDALGSAGHTQSQQPIHEDLQANHLYIDYAQLEEALAAPLQSLLSRLPKTSPNARTRSQAPI